MALTIRNIELVPATASAPARRLCLYLGQDRQWRSSRLGPGAVWTPIVPIAERIARAYLRREKRRINPA